MDIVLNPSYDGLTSSLPTNYMKQTGTVTTAQDLLLFGV